jgi:flagellar motor component MotA
VFFSTAPLDLLTTPAYITGIIIVSVLLGTIAAGVALYNHKKNWALLIIGVGTMLYFVQFREILLSFIGLATLFVNF